LIVFIVIRSFFWKGEGKEVSFSFFFISLFSLSLFNSLSLSLFSSFSLIYLVPGGEYGLVLEEVEDLELRVKVRHARHGRPS
jgi:hypothetical protein